MQSKLFMIEEKESWLNIWIEENYPFRKEMKMKDKAKDIRLCNLSINNIKLKMSNIIWK